MLYKPYGQMACADGKLCHRAVAIGGHAANVFVAVYRKKRGGAQKVDFFGHDIAEPRIGEKRCFFEPGLERFARVLHESKSGLRTLFVRYPDARTGHFIEAGQTDATYCGYHDAAFNGASIYRVQAWIGWLRSAILTVLILTGGLLLWRGA